MLELYYDSENGIICITNIDPPEEYKKLFENITDKNYIFHIFDDVVGGNQKFIRKLNNNEKYGIRVSIEDLNFIEKIGLEYFKSHKPSDNEFKFWVRCCSKLKDLVNKKIENLDKEQPDFAGDEDKI